MYFLVKKKKKTRKNDLKLTNERRKYLTARLQTYANANIRLRECTFSSVSTKGKEHLSDSSREGDVQALRRGAVTVNLVRLPDKSNEE